MMHSNIAHVQCRAKDCGAEYDQRVDPMAWDGAHEVGSLGIPYCCGVCCGSRSAVVTEARGPVKVRI